MSSLCRLTLPILAVALASTPAVAQKPASARSDASPSKSVAKTAKRSQKGWRVSPAAVDLSSEYVDNVFLLKDSRRDNLDTPGAGDAVSGRYAGMLSASDLVTTLDAGLTVRGPGAFGRTLAITPEVRYEFYAANAIRRNTTVGLELEQSLRRGGELRVRGRHTPSYFARNYLADAVDIDASGTIDYAERVYEPGTYQETDLSVDYRRRLSKSTKRSPFGAAVRLGAGYYSRSYDEPFGGRDLSGPTAKIELLTRVARRVDLDLGYELAALSAHPTDEVLLLDEPDLGRDLNGNGSTSDMDVRSIQTVDRSRLENRFGTGMRLELNRVTDLDLDYERRWRSYGSEEPLDVAYNGRSAARDRVSGAVRLRLARGIHLGLGGSVAAQRLSRENDFGSTGEIGDYSRRSFFVRLGYRFPVVR